MRKIQTNYNIQLKLDNDFTSLEFLKHGLLQLMIIENQIVSKSLTEKLRGYY